LDSARAGDAVVFESEARAMGQATSLGDEHQERFNAAVVVRGLVALGRHAEALAWARDEGRLFDLRVPASLSRLVLRRSRVDTHPEVSVARALCRALRRTGQSQEAAALAGRVPVRDTDGALAAFSALLVHLEASLALAD